MNNVDKKNEPLLKEFDIDVFNTMSSRPLNFNPEEHKILNSLLKHLYTAITRARVNVWIFDEDEESRKPMFEFFKTLGVVRVIGKKADDLDLEIDVVDGFAVTSTSEKWKAKGHEFYFRKLFDLAAKCYRKGGCHELSRLALTNGRALKAIRIQDNSRLQREEFLLIAKEFLELGMIEQAAKCLQHARYYELSATLFMLLGQSNKVFLVFDKAKNYSMAAEALEKLGQHVEAIKYLLKHELYLEALGARERAKRGIERLYATNPSQLKRELHQLPEERAILLKGAKAYRTTANSDKLRMILSSLPLEERISFLLDQNDILGAAKVYADADKKAESAKLLYDNGYLKEALEYARDTDDVLIISDCMTLLSEKYYWEWDLNGRQNEVAMEAARKFLQESIEKADLAKSSQNSGYCRLLLAMLSNDLSVLRSAFTELRNQNCDFGLVVILRHVALWENKLFDNGGESGARLSWIRELLYAYQQLTKLVESFHSYRLSTTVSVNNLVSKALDFLGLSVRSTNSSVLTIRTGGLPYIRSILFRNGRHDIWKKTSTLQFTEVCEAVFVFLNDTMNTCLFFLLENLSNDLFSNAVCPVLCVENVCQEEQRGVCSYSFHPTDGAYYPTVDSFKEAVLSAGFLLRFAHLTHKHINLLKDNTIKFNYIVRFERTNKISLFYTMYLDIVYPRVPIYEVINPGILPCVQYFYSDLKYFQNFVTQTNYNNPIQNKMFKIIGILDSTFTSNRPSARLPSTVSERSSVFSAENLPECLKPFALRDDFCGICGLRLDNSDSSDRDMFQTESFGFKFDSPSRAEHQKDKSHLKRCTSFHSFSTVIVSLDSKITSFRAFVIGVKERLQSVARESFQNLDKLTEQLELFENDEHKFMTLVEDLTTLTQQIQASLRWQAFRTVKAKLKDLELHVNYIGNKYQLAKNDALLIISPPAHTLPSYSESAAETAGVLLTGTSYQESESDFQQELFGNDDNDNEFRFQKKSRKMNRNNLAPRFRKLRKY